MFNVGSGPGFRHTFTEQQHPKVPQALALRPRDSQARDHEQLASTRHSLPMAFWVLLSLACLLTQAAVPPWLQEATVGALCANESL